MTGFLPLAGGEKEIRQVARFLNKQENHNEDSYKENGCG
jgi:hypothetical protein